LLLILAIVEKVKQGTRLIATNGGLEQTDMLAMLAERTVLYALALPLVSKLPNVIHFARGLRHGDTARIRL
jgi:hypothetical protein